MAMNPSCPRASRDCAPRCRSGRTMPRLLCGRLANAFAAGGVRAPVPRCWGGSTVGYGRILNERERQSGESEEPPEQDPIAAMKLDSQWRRGISPPSPVLRAESPRILRFARSLLPPAEADEIVQEAFLRLWQQAPTWRPKAASRPGSIRSSTACASISCAAGGRRWRSTP